MHFLNLEQWSRRKHFEFFKNMANPHVNFCANVDITHFRAFIKKSQLPFTQTIVYIVANTANAIKEFRYRIRGEEVVVHDRVHPSFTVMTDMEDVFTFCTVNYQPELKPFIQHTTEVMDFRKLNPTLEDEPGQDNLLFLSSIPWFSFTSFQHPMHTPSIDSVPRIAWGKYFEENGCIKMPLAVQAHHGLVDGVHVGRYYQHFQDLLDTPERLLR
ncbi:MAG: chloramphenicol acetyltransferase [Chitinophagales bacterium]